MKKIIKYASAGLLAQFLPLVTLAQVDLTKSRISQIFESFVSWFAGIVGILGILMMLYAAFAYMTAGGDEEKTTKAKKILIFGLVGVGIAIIAYGVFGLVESFLT